MSKNLQMKRQEIRTRNRLVEILPTVNDNVVPTEIASTLRQISGVLAHSQLDRAQEKGLLRIMNDEALSLYIRSLAYDALVVGRRPPDDPYVQRFSQLLRPGEGYMECRFDR